MFTLKKPVAIKTIQKRKVYYKLIVLVSYIQQKLDDLIETCYAKHNSSERDPTLPQVSLEIVIDTHRVECLKYHGVVFEDVKKTYRANGDEPC